MIRLILFSVKFELMLIYFAQSVDSLFIKATQFRDLLLMNTVNLLQFFTDVSAIKFTLKGMVAIKHGKYATTGKGTRYRDSRTIGTKRLIKIWLAIPQGTMKA